MFNDLTKTHQRMRRVPDAKLSDYVLPLVYAVIALPFIYTFVVVYGLVMK